MTLPVDFSSANLNVGSSLPESSGSGTLFMKLVSPPSARPLATIAVVAAAAAAAAKNSRRWESAIATLLPSASSEISKTAGVSLVEAGESVTRAVVLCLQRGAADDLAEGALAPLDRPCPG